MTRKELMKKLAESNRKEDKEKLFEILNASQIYEVIYKLSDFKEILKELRLYEEMTQEQFARHIGVDRSTLSRYEIGEREIPINVIDRVLDMYDLKMTISRKDSDFDDEIATYEKEQRKKIVELLLTNTEK